MGRDKRRFDIVLAIYNGHPNVRYAAIDGNMIRDLVRNKHLQPNDLIRWSGDDVWFFAWQVGLFTAEQLEGVSLRKDNLPPSHRGNWQPESHPFLPHFFDRVGNPTELVTDVL